MIRAGSVTLLFCLAALLPHGPAPAQDEAVIEITQTGCQFLEAEKSDLGFEPAEAADCKAINAETEEGRLADHKILTLTPGTYVFRVTNTDVPYELGFYLRSEDRSLIPFLPRVSGGGIFQGETRDFVVELSEGRYIYGCPLNPTPAYTLVVQ